MDPHPSPSAGRLSKGLEQFLHGIRDSEGLRVLDLAGGSQSNIQYIAELGHKPTQDDLQHALKESFWGGDFLANQSDPKRIETFVSLTLDHKAGTFQAILVWDALQFLAQPLLEEVVSQLHRITAPGAQLLAYFHADAKMEQTPAVTYHIVDRQTVRIAPRSYECPARFLSNRDIEKLFAAFGAIKFFVTRDHLREVIVRR